MGEIFLKTLMYSDDTIGNQEEADKLIRTLELTAEHQEPRSRGEKAVIAAERRSRNPPPTGEVHYGKRSIPTPRGTHRPAYVDGLRALLGRDDPESQEYKTCLVQVFVCPCEEGC